MHLADLARYIEWSWQTYDDGRMQLRFDENESQVVTNWQQQLVFRSYLITSVTRLETMLQATKSQLPNFLKAKPIKNCSMQISYKCVGYSVRLYSSHAATLAMSFKSPACSASACPLRLVNLCSQCLKQLCSVATWIKKLMLILKLFTCCIICFRKCWNNLKHVQIYAPKQNVNSSSDANSSHFDAHLRSKPMALCSLSNPSCQWVQATQGLSHLCQTRNWKSEKRFSHRKFLVNSLAFQLHPAPTENPQILWLKIIVVLHCFSKIYILIKLAWCIPF